MPFDQGAAEALVSDATHAFVEGLKQLIDSAVAEVAVECQRLVDGARALEERSVRLDEERGRLESERERFEVERALFGSTGAELDDAVSLNLGGEAHIMVLRSTLTQCEDSMLAAAFSGRWDLPKDSDGSVFVDFEPSLFVPLVQHMRMRRIEDPSDPTPPPCLETPQLEARFQRMLKYYGLEEFIYRDRGGGHPDAVHHQVCIGDRSYAVLPPQSPDEAVASGDMSCQTVTVPRGWEVLSTEVEGFEDIIRQLACRTWGALRLCCENARGEGFSSYLTRLHGGGTAGTRWSGDARMLQAVHTSVGRQFRFSSACSARLVIRKSRPEVAGEHPPEIARSERPDGRRLAVI